MGGCEVDIQNSLNKGLYTEIKSEEPVTAKQVKEIQKRMEELIAADLPLERTKLTKEEAEQFFVSTGEPERSRCSKKIRT